ncbi:MAG: hypothetical protein ACK4VS_09865 [Burkholderiales bacterium]|jgi:hypothetical protein
MITRESRTVPQRGCGARKAGGAYLCTATGSDGVPFEHFVFDPPRPFDYEPFRAPILFPDPNVEGLNHVLIWIGEEFYPSPLDFLEELKVYGVSRRIPNEFQFEKLRPGSSKMMFVHPRAVLPKGLVSKIGCTQGRTPEEHKENTCFFCHAQTVQALGSKVSGSENALRATIGTVSYEVPEQDVVDKKDFQTGVFLRLPVTHIEYQATSATDPGNHYLEKASDAGFDVVVIDDPELYL